MSGTDTEIRTQQVCTELENASKNLFLNSVKALSRARVDLLNTYLLSARAETACQKWGCSLFIIHEAS